MTNDAGLQQTEPPPAPAAGMGTRRSLYYLAGLLIVLLVIVNLNLRQTHSSKYLGQQIEFRGMGFSGQFFDLKAQRGKVVLINFWATYCPYCLEEMPHLEKIYTDLRYDDFVVVGVSSDQRLELEAFLSRQPQPWENIFGLDSVRLGSYYQVETIPRTFLIDREGILVAVGSGVQELQNDIYDLVRKG